MAPNLEQTRLVFEASNDPDNRLYKIVLAQARTKAGKLICKVFSDGEVYHQLISNVNRADVIIVGSLATNASILKLFDMLCLVMDEGARGLTLIIDDPRRIFSVLASHDDQLSLERRCFERMLSAIPPSANGNRLIVVDANQESEESLAVSLASAQPHQHQVRLIPEIQPDLDVFAKGKKLLFATARYRGLRDAILDHGAGAFDCGLTDLVMPAQGDCERFAGLANDVEGRDVVIVSGTTDDDETMELWHLANALADAGVGALELFINYFGYARQERKSKSGEAVKAEYRARLFSHIPRCPVRIKITMIDLHTDGIPMYFDKKRVRSEHLYVAESLVRYVLQRDFDYDAFLARGHDPKVIERALKDIALGSTDAGRAKWVEQMARKLLIDYVICHKRHVPQTEAAKTANEEVAVYTYVGRVVSMLIAVYDDILSTGGTAIKALSLYDREGAEALIFIITHGLFVEDAIDKLTQARGKSGNKLIKYVYTTDTHWRSVEVVEQLRAAGNDFVRMFSVAPIVADYLVNGHPLDRERE
jgi:ribose-phosphate pyrophosphokinase